MKSDKNNNDIDRDYALVYLVAYRAMLYRWLYVDQKPTSFGTKRRSGVISVQLTLRGVQVWTYLENLEKTKRL